MSLKIAVIGTGYMARKHCDALKAHPSATLATICATDRSRAKGDELRERHGFATVATDPAALFKRAPVDVRG